mmetsp:Transcript_26911/g.74175  ORF Transcript_26911/g.74175 Transcript_26911/m.74175 type:complete len:221 (+) Transcript_26911:647-1309(+)
MRPSMRVYSMPLASKTLAIMSKYDRNWEKTTAFSSRAISWMFRSNTSILGEELPRSSGSDAFPWSPSSLFWEAAARAALFFTIESGLKRFRQKGHFLVVWATRDMHGSQNTWEHSRKTTAVSSCKLSKHTAHSSVSAFEAVPSAVVSFSKSFCPSSALSSWFPSEQWSRHALRAASRRSFGTRVEEQQHWRIRRRTSRMEEYFWKGLSPSIIARIARRNV